MAIAYLVIGAPLSFFLPKLVTRTSVTRVVQGKSVTTSTTAASVSERLLEVYQTSMLVGLAILETAGFFATIAYLVEERLEALAIVAAVIVMMLLRFPTANRIRLWIVQQAGLIDQLRQQDHFVTKSF